MVQDVKPKRSLKVLQRRDLLYKVAQEEIKSYIISNQLKPGDAVPPETELAQQFNISRNSVREAVKSLETLGILEARPGSGLFVRNFSFDPILSNLGYGIMFDLKQVADVLEVRSVIECGMAERVLRAVVPEQLDRLRAVLARMRQLAERGEYSAEDDRLFHQVLNERLDNTLVSKVLDIFWVVFYQAKQRAAIPEPADPMETYERHAEIVEALEQDDVQGFQVAMARHHQGIRRRLKRAQELESQGGSGPERSP
ncbi:MAG TPA: FadR/GntR family transcriptional regulator [Isosphaeraceae bacterium]|nr:FadR/GntR family transcriptional regulator [Isosphaeraceae bacterium]